MSHKHSDTFSQQLTNNRRSLLILHHASTMAETRLDQRAQVATCELLHHVGQQESGEIPCNISCTWGHCNLQRHIRVAKIIRTIQIMPAYSSIHPPPEMFRRSKIIGEPPTFRSGSIEDGQLLILLRSRGARRCGACNMSRRCHIAPTRHPPPLQQLSDLCLGAVQPGSELCPDI